MNDKKQLQDLLSATRMRILTIKLIVENIRNNKRKQDLLNEKIELEQDVIDIQQALFSK